ncbi:Zinc finger, RING-type,Zinc finger, RING/FYVE/PHD-type,WWE domain, subgroup,Zinc finger, RING- [Cinara cedri]|uniref:E3 ubiquitin-protein ligase n=1 Tax=Cinara cedri TaxID=506608 RepID=A0A5E4NK90_9HEMI|nr:Zinc finger, RING-type,Zinc finger, RING/FYVE/PHD-type,WWE domain, subgroup,Zinc finger, RING- [Cinara cedri]
MAECLNGFEYQRRSDDEEEEDKTEKSKSEIIECPICLGPAVFPILIPCGHVFCFLCIKGVVQQSNICPMCRQAVPNNFYKNPIFLEYLGHNQEDFDHDGYQWFYECRSGGWWQYEKRTSEEIEQNYQLNNKKFNLLICGTLYTIDLDRNVQYSVDNPSKRRKLKRENGSNLLVKGIAGIHYLL